MSPSKASTFAEPDFRALAACWHPVAFSDEVGTAPVAAELLDEPLVVFRTASGIHVARDLCIHRGAALSKGWVENDELVCGYHGFRFAADGRCTRIPAMPELPISPKLCLRTYPAVERGGLVWTCLGGEPAHPLPDWPETADPRYRYLHLPPQVWNASAARAIENFLDVAHFSWIHCGTFGNRELPEVQRYELEPKQGGFRMEYPYLAQNPAGSPLPEEKFIQRRMSYELTLPFAARLAIHYEGNRRYCIFDACAPVSARRVKIFFAVAMDFDHHKSAEEILGWEQRVLAEDKPIVESQRPEELPLDLSEEFHLRFDRASTAYRQGLARLGLTP
jgi:phenylpropionate dioxygenase-like ring-hydroxylating dioxygenase large terminal subunit